MSKSVVDSSVEYIENLTAPPLMSAADALETLEDIIERLRSNCEALREEMGEDE